MSFYCFVVYCKDGYFNCPRKYQEHFSRAVHVLKLCLHSITSMVVTCEILFSEKQLWSHYLFNLVWWIKFAREWAFDFTPSYVVILAR